MNLSHNLIEAFLLGAAAHIVVDGEWDSDLMKQLEEPSPIEQQFVCLFVYKGGVMEILFNSTFIGAFCISIFTVGLIVVSFVFKEFDQYEQSKDKSYT